MESDGNWRGQLKAQEDGYDPLQTVVRLVIESSPALGSLADSNLPAHPPQGRSS